MIFAARAARFFVRGVTERCLHFTMGRTRTIPYEGSGVIFSYNFRFGENNNDPDKSGFVEMINMIKECTTEHITEYGKIYATAFSGEPWNDNWKPETQKYISVKLWNQSSPMGMRNRTF